MQNTQYPNLGMKKNHIIDLSVHVNKWAQTEYVLQ